MRVVNIRVAKTDGAPITVATAIVRYIGYIVDSIILWPADPFHLGRV